MKFNEKLQKLRKENQMSQEQLADLLDVSRQAVSKWESGTTYPEMDKLLMLCKIFKCTLDELTNDNISEITVEEKEEKKKKNWINILLEYLNKTIKMIKAMSFHNILSMIIKMLLVFIFLVVLSIPVYGLYLLGKSIFYIIGEGIGEVLSNLWLFLLSISYAILSVTIFLYTFKVQYLDDFDDKYTQVKNDEVTKKEEIENTKIQVVYRNTPNSPIFQVFGKLCTYMFKTIIFFMSIPFFLFFVFLFIVLILMLYCLFSGVTYIGFLMAVLFSILLVFTIIKFLMEVLFSRKTNFNAMFRFVILSIAGIGISIGMCIFEIADSTFQNTLPNNVKLSTISQTIPYEDGAFIDLHNEYLYNVSYVEDQSLNNNIKIEITYVESFQSPSIAIYENKRIGIYSEERIGNIQNIILNDLRNKEFHSYDLLYNLDVTIYGSKKTLNLLKENYEVLIRTEQENELISCRQENQELNNRLEMYSDYGYLETEIEQKEKEIEELRNKNEDMQNEINRYKETLQDLINN